MTGDRSDPVRLQRDLAVAMAAAESEQSALAALLDAAMQLDGIDGCGGYLRPPCQGPLLLAAHRGVSASFAETVAEWSLTGPGMTTLARGGVARLAHGGDSEQLGEWQEPSRCEGFLFSFAVPIVADSELLAVGVFASRSRVEIDQSTLDLLETLVRQVGLVLRRLRAETQRRELEQLLGHALRMARIGTWRWRCASDEVMWSDEMYEIYGRERDDYQPTINFLRDLAHPEDGEPTLQLLEASDGVKTSSTFEQRVQRPDGSFRRVVCQLEARSDGGALREVVGVVHDVTDRRRTEDALARRLRYETAIGSVSSALVSGGAATFERVCEHLLAATTVSRVYLHRRVDDPELGPCTRLIAEVCAPGIHPNFGTQELQLFPILSGGFERTHRLLSDGEAVQGVVEYFPPSEREILERYGVRSLLLLPILVAGRYWGLIGFDDCEQPRIWRAEDVLLLRTVAGMLGRHVEVERVNAEVRRLVRHRAVETFRLITDHVRDVIWMADLDLRFSYLSPSLVEVLGVTPERALRRSLAEAIGEHDLETLRRVLTEELERDRVLGEIAPYRVRSLELELRHGDGRTVPLEVFITFLRDSDGRADGLLGVARPRA